MRLAFVLTLAACAAADDAAPARRRLCDKLRVAASGDSITHRAAPHRYVSDVTLSTRRARAKITRRTDFETRRPQNGRPEKTRRLGRRNDIPYPERLGKLLGSDCWKVTNYGIGGKAVNAEKDSRKPA